MQIVLEYIMLNYAWLLLGSIIILLAIIGYYADKTNFGQGKIKDENIDTNKIDKKLLEGKRLEDLLGNNKDNIEEPSTNLQEESLEIANNNLEAWDNETLYNNENNISLPEKQINKDINTLEQTEKKFEKFDEEFNQLLPEKNIIDDELLDEINNLSLDKTQKINLSDIPNLDDVDLPKIKPLQIEEEDIWKF